MIVGLASDTLCKIAGCLLLDEQKNELPEISGMTIFHEQPDGG